MSNLRRTELPPAFDFSFGSQVDLTRQCAKENSWSGETIEISPNSFNLARSLFASDNLVSFLKTKTKTPTMRMKTSRDLARHIPEPSTNTRVIKIVWSTACDNLSLPDSTRCDGCIRPQGQPGSKYSARQYLCKRYFAQNVSQQDATKQWGTSQAVAAYRKAWEELVKIGYTKPDSFNKKQFFQPCLSKPKVKPKSSPPPAVKKIPSAEANKLALPSTNKKTRLQTIGWFLNTKCNSEMAKLIENLCNVVDTLVLHLDKSIETSKVQHSMIPSTINLINLTKLPDSIDLSNLRDSPPPQQTRAPVTNDADTAAGVKALVQLAAATPPPEVINLSDIQPAAQLLANHFNHVPPSKSKHDGNNKITLVSLPCSNIVRDVPGLYDVKSYTKIREWEKYEKIVKAITKHLEGKKYVGTPMDKKLLASALVQLPSLSARGAKNIIACIVGSFCADSGISFEQEQVVNSCVKRNALTKLLKKNGVKTIHELRELVEDVLRNSLIRA
jgi:hypothetical protein